jgi:hypothetical protein
MNPKYVQIDYRYCIQTDPASMKTLHQVHAVPASMQDCRSYIHADPASMQILHPCRSCMNETDTNIQASSFKSVQIDRRYCIQAYLASIA